VFLCHAGEDKHMVETVADALQAAKKPFFMDSRNIRPGMHFINEIYNAHANASHVLVFGSKDSGRKRWPSFEAKRGGKRRQHIVVVPIDDGAARDIAKELDCDTVARDNVITWIDTHPAVKERPSRRCAGN
jgi:hypothetical protein